MNLWLEQLLQLSTSPSLFPIWLDDLIWQPPEFTGVQQWEPSVSWALVFSHLLRTKNELMLYSILWLVLQCTGHLDVRKGGKKQDWIDDCTFKVVLICSFSPLMVLGFPPFPSEEKNMEVEYPRYNTLWIWCFKWIQTDHTYSDSESLMLLLYL